MERLTARQPQTRQAAGSTDAAAAVPAAGAGSTVHAAEAADGALQRRLFELQAQLCAALADPTRLQILHLLRDQERTVADLMSALGQRQNNISQHLAYLRRVGAVAGERRGTFVYYRVAMPGLVEACDAVRAALLRQLAAQADEAASLTRAGSVTSTDMASADPARPAGTPEPAPIA